MYNIGFFAPSMRHGKTESFKHLKAKYGYTSLTLAETMKKMVRILLEDLGLSTDEVTERLYGNRKEEVIPELGVSARYILQTIGTDYARKMIHENIWMMIAIRKLGSNLTCCDDVRRLNEAESLKNANFKLVRVVNPRIEIIRNHESEGELDNFPADYHINNDGDIPSLYSKVEAMLDYFGR